MTTCLRSSAAPTLLRSLRAPRSLLPSPPKFSRSYNSRPKESPFVRFFPLIGLVPIPFIYYYKTTAVDLEDDQVPAGTGGNEKMISLEELKTHNSIKDGLWVAIKGDVWDLTEYHHQHPGGPQVILKNAGKDNTKFFIHAHGPNLNVHEQLDPSKLMGKLEGYVGPVQTVKKQKVVERMKVPRREQPATSS